MAIAKVKQFVYLPNVVDCKIEVMLPNIYSDFSTVVGIFSPTLIYNPNLRLTSNELRRNGVFAKIHARTESGRTHDVYCAVDKLSSALPQLVGKNIPEQEGNNVVAKKIVKTSLALKRSRL